MSFLNRRDFLRASAGMAGVLAGTEVLHDTTQAQQANNPPNSPNERIHVACIGVNGQGRSHVRSIAGRNNCVVTHICDTDTAVVGPAMTSAETQQGRRPTYVQDLRRIMDDNSIHAVSIATPNHWHALAAIWALQAGKDVYVEKPVSHNVWEGRRIVDIARRNNRICQTGTQIRSAPGIREAMEYLRSGQLGRVQVARGLCYKRRNSIGKTEGEQAVPATLDYDIWSGPAQRLPLRRARLHYDWHWVWEYGNGDLGNQGIHQMDLARWGLGKSEMPRSCISVGGRFGYVDDGESANTQICVFNYGDSELIFEVRGLQTEANRGAMVGNIFHCENGVLVIPSYSTAIAYNNDGGVIRRFGGLLDPLPLHFTNFFNAVRSRRTEDQHGPIVEGHISSALCHLGNISYRLGTPQPFNGRNNAFGDDQAAGETFQRMRDHLTANQIPLPETMYQLGRRLTLDGATERLTGDDEANRMLTREYRRGFAVPERDA